MRVVNALVLGTTVALAACRVVGVRAGGTGASCAATATATTPAAYATVVAGADHMISGEVRDALTGKALRGVTVELRQGTYKDVTDSTGSFRFTGISNGTWNITARRYDYASQSALVKLDPGTGANVSFELLSLRCDGGNSTPVDHSGKPRPVPSRPPTRVP